jgi:uncharacterized membrane protein YeaQ/YmgE (transglycosylase-associated protein family)
MKERLKAMNREHGVLLRVVIGAVGVLVFLGVVYGVWAFVKPTTAEQKTAFVQTVSGVVGGIAVLLGIFFTWRSQVITQGNIATTQETTKEQLKNSEEQLRLTREGQITERFTRAIDQLGKTAEHEGKHDVKHLEVRLGGIYALERIAIEAPSDYHWPIMQIFTAYLQAHASGQASAINKVESDIQTILSAIGRRNLHFEAGEDERLNLYRTDLSQYDLSGAHLEGAYLIDTDLQRASLNNAHLQKAQLLGASLEGAYLIDTDLTEADLRGAHLEGAHLVRATLTGADLGGAHLGRANISGANLEGVKNLPVNLDGVNGDLTVTLPEGFNQPAWWSKLPGTDDPLYPQEYSIKVCDKVALHFHVDEGWYSQLMLPSGFGLSHVGVTFTGSILSFQSPQWVCDPQKPNERYAIKRAPTDMFNWFLDHPYLDLENVHEVDINGASGTQFDVDVTVSEDNILEGHDKPGVPLFILMPRYDPTTLDVGNRNRIKIVNRAGETIVVVIESPPDDFGRFCEEAEELLATLRWEP